MLSSTELISINAILRLLLCIPNRTFDIHCVYVCLKNKNSDFIGYYRMYGEHHCQKNISLLKLCNIFRKECLLMPFQIQRDLSLAPQLISDVVGKNGHRQTSSKIHNTIIQHCFQSFGYNWRRILLLGPCPCVTLMARAII